MPAYTQQHLEAELAAVVCPSCVGRFPMYVRDVEANWSMAKIDFTYECADCGTEIKQTITRDERRH